VHQPPAKAGRVPRRDLASQFAICRAGGIAHRPAPSQVSADALLSSDCGQAQAVAAGPSRGPAFVLWEVSRPHPAGPRLSPEAGRNRQAPLLHRAGAEIAAFCWPLLRERRLVSWKLRCTFETTVRTSKPPAIFETSARQQLLPLSEVGRMKRSWTPGRARVESAMWSSSRV
jgi:hypothetical protein